MDNHINEFKGELVNLLGGMGYNVIEGLQGNYKFELIIIIDSYNNSLEVSFRENENYIYLEFLNIHEEIRLKGYGREIVNSIIDIANEYEIIDCIRLSYKIESKGFWEKIGFEEAKVDEHLNNRALGQMILKL